MTGRKLPICAAVVHYPPSPTLHPKVIFCRCLSVNRRGYLLSRSCLGRSYLVPVWGTPWSCLGRSCPGEGYHQDRASEYPLDRTGGTSSHSFSIEQDQGYPTDRSRRYPTAPGMVHGGAGVMPPEFTEDFLVYIRTNTV